MGIHYPDQIEQDRIKQEQEKTNSHYSNRLNGIQTVCEMIEIELGNTYPNEVKLESMLSQIKCISEV